MLLCCAVEHDARKVCVQVLLTTARFEAQLRATCTLVGRRFFEIWRAGARQIKKKKNLSLERRQEH